MAAATRRKKKLDFPTAQFFIVITMGLSLFLLFGITHRVALNYRVHQRKVVLEQHYAMLVQENAQLVQKYQKVQSNAYVESVARRELRWSRPGEKMVVVIAPPHAGSISTTPLETSSIPVPPEAPVAKSDEPLDQWVELFFPTKP